MILLIIIIHSLSFDNATTFLRYVLNEMELVIEKQNTHQHLPNAKHPYPVGAIELTHHQHHIQHAKLRAPWEKGSRKTSTRSLSRSGSSSLKGKLHRKSNNRTWILGTAPHLWLASACCAMKFDTYHIYTYNRFYLYKTAYAKNTGNMNKPTGRVLTIV